MRRRAATERRSRCAPSGRRRADSRSAKRRSKRSCTRRRRPARTRAPKGPRTASAGRGLSSTIPLPRARDQPPSGPGSGSTPRSRLPVRIEDVDESWIRQRGAESGEGRQEGQGIAGEFSHGMKALIGCEGEQRGAYDHGEHLPPGRAPVTRPAPKQVGTREDPSVDVQREGCEQDGRVDGCQPVAPAFLEQRQNPGGQEHGKRRGCVHSGRGAPHRGISVTGEEERRQPGRARSHAPGGGPQQPDRSHTAEGRGQAERRNRGARQLHPEPHCNRVPGRMRVRHQVVDDSLGQARAHARIGEFPGKGNQGRPHFRVRKASGFQRREPDPGTNRQYEGRGDPPNREHRESLRQASGNSIRFPSHCER